MLLFPRSTHTASTLVSMPLRQLMTTLTLKATATVMVSTRRARYFENPSGSAYVQSKGPCTVCETLYLNICGVVDTKVSIQNVTRHEVDIQATRPFSLPCVLIWISAQKRLGVFYKNDHLFDSNVLGWR